jgi:hypothetical protein
MFRIQIHSPDLWFDRMFLVDGMARSGKSLIASALSNLREVEPWQLPISVDHVVKYLELGEFSPEAAAAALRINLNSHAFDYAVGRGLNRRRSDWSNVSANGSESLLMAREQDNSYEELLQRFREEALIPLFVTHEQIAYLNFWMASISELRFLEVSRHPATLMMSWERRNLTERWGRDPLLFVPCLSFEDKPYPIFAMNHEVEWFESSPFERLLLSLELQYEQLWATVNTLTEEDKARFRLIRIESFKSNSWSTIEKLANWLKIEGPGSEFVSFMSSQSLPKENRDTEIVESTNDILVRFPLNLHGRINSLINRYDELVHSHGDIVI